MRKTNPFHETADNGRVVIDLGDGTILDTDALLGATGYRGPVYLPGYSSGRAEVYRYGRVVSLVLYGAVTTLTVPKLPAGFWPANHVLVGHSGMTASGPRYVVNAGTGELQSVGIAEGTTLYLTTAWMTDDPMPAP